MIINSVICKWASSVDSVHFKLCRCGLPLLSLYSSLFLLKSFTLSTATAFTSSSANAIISCSVCVVQFACVAVHFISPGMACFIVYRHNSDHSSVMQFISCSVSTSHPMIWVHLLMFTCWKCCVQFDWWDLKGVNASWRPWLHQCINIIVEIVPSPALLFSLKVPLLSSSSWCQPQDAETLRRPPANSGSQIF